MVYGRLMDTAALPCFQPGPIEWGLVTSMALSGDGSRQFASYGGPGEVLVMDTSQLIAAGESLARSPHDAKWTPLDQAGFNVHITPLTVGWLV